MNKDDLIVVTGAGGFIGGHLIENLKQEGFTKLRAIDIKPFDEWYQPLMVLKTFKVILRKSKNAEEPAKMPVLCIISLQIMGGMGFIELNKTECMLSVLISTHMLMAAQEVGVERFFYASSACVYAAGKQTDANVTALKEEDAYPAQAEDGYGWEKLFSERMCRHYREDHGIITRVARYHNVYGPYGTYEGDRPKAPAALCRKIILAKLSGKHEIEIWGDGEQTRSFMYIDDCIYGTKTILASDILEPINLGSSELVSINHLVDIIEDIAGIKVKRNYVLDAPQGVRGRNSDNTLIQKYLDWEPSITLRDGLEKTYAWIYDQILSKNPAPL